MDERDREALQELLEHARRAIEYARGQGPAWYATNLTLDAVLMRIVQVSEAAKRVGPETLAAIPAIDWRTVKGIRERIVHDYSQIDVVVIRGVVDRHLPALIAAVEEALRFA